jgi:TRAP-type C4-dicarboxylate transport system substrate-binding protein
MKKTLFFGLSVLLIVAVSWFIVGSEATSAEKPMEIIFAASLPANAPAAQVVVKFGERVEQRSGNRVKFVYYWANTLLPSAEIVKGLRSGVCDMSTIWSGTQDYLPLTYNIMYMPFMGYPSMKEGAAIYSQLYAKFPAFSQEFVAAGLKRLSSRLWPAVQLHTTKKAVKTVSDLKGMKIAVVGGGKLADLLKLMGAAPVNISPGELNLALQSGVVEGWTEHFPAVNVFGVMARVPYHTIFGAGGISMGLQSLAMSSKAFDKLPPDVQKIIEEEAVKWNVESTDIDTAEIERAVNMAKEMKHTFINLTPQEIQQWSEHATDIHKQWIAEMEAKGKPAKAIYEEAKRLIQGARGK